MDRVSSHPVLSCAEAKAWEAGLLRDETAEWDAMQRAGAALARAIEEDSKEIGGLPANARILVLTGRGHNGGDALIAATVLMRHRPAARVEVALAFPEGGSPRPLTQRAHRELVRAVGAQQEPFDWKQGMTNSYDLCLDGVFGMQFRLPMPEATAKLLAWVNTHPRIRLRAAVDLPSGLGAENAGTVFRADFTYATGIAKSPVVATANAPLVGRLRCLDLGFFAAGEPAGTGERILVPGIMAPLAALRPAQTDKRTFGHLFVAVRAALRSGAGLVTAFVPASFAAEYAARHPEAMWVGCPENASGGLAGGTVDFIQQRLTRATALLMGPGMSAEPEVLRTMEAIVRNTNIPLVLDADALRPEVLVAADGRSVICTPHAGEYERLGGMAGLRPTSGESEVIAVLKGSLTRIVVASDRSETGPVYYSPFGGPVLARGGSGDILAGLIGGLLAQTPGEPLLAACRGTVWHGRAADLLARARVQVAVEISEILEQLGPALNS
jgi:ADP-dependent NAD(P)H-hydrate dehydratase / NAD(P)H-hydrate epimerase